MVPVDRWYKFQQKRNVATFTLEEAEEQVIKELYDVCDVLFIDLELVEESAKA